MLTVNLCQQLKLTEKQLILLRASANGHEAGDDELFEQKVEEVKKLTGLDHPSAERRLIANVRHELELLNENRENHWLQKLASDDSTVVHDTTGIETSHF